MRSRTFLLIYVMITSGFRWGLGWHAPHTLRLMRCHCRLDRLEVLCSGAPTKRRITSPATIPRTPPSGFDNAVATQISLLLSLSRRGRRCSLRHEQKLLKNFLWSKIERSLWLIHEQVVWQWVAWDRWSPSLLQVTRFPMPFVPTTILPSERTRHPGFQILLVVHHTSLTNCPH